MKKIRKLKSKVKKNNIPKMSVGGILQSTTSGVGAGAGIGSMLGPGGAGVGAIIGGGLGLIGGLFGNSAENKAKKMEAAKLRNTELDMELAQEELDRSDEQFRYGQFAEDGNYQQGFFAKGGAVHTMPDGTVMAGTVMAGATHPNINTDSSQRRIGDGIQVNTNKSGTDTIDANIEGRQVKLDNNEIIVMDSNNQPVVISDDLGEATKYRKAIKGKSKAQVDGITKVFAERAKIKGINGGTNYQLGGTIDPVTGLPINNYNWLQDSRDMTNDYNKYITSNNNYVKPNINPAINSTITKDNITNPNQIAPASNAYINRLGSNYQFTNQPINTKLASNIALPTQASQAPSVVDPSKGFNTINAIGQAGNFALGITNTLENASARKKLAETSLPSPVIPKYSDLNVNINDPLYNLQRSRIGAGSKALGNAIQRNTSSSTTAVAALSNVEANRLNAESGTFAEQRVAQDRIRNTNISRRNAYDAQVAGIGNQFNQMAYQDRIGRINTDLALAKSSIAGAQGIIDNLQKGQYDREQIKALGASFGLRLTGSESMDELVRLFKQGTNKLVETVVA